MSKTSRRILEFQADRIEAVLSRYNVRARVTGGTVAPRWIQFQVLPRLGARISHIKGLAEELALALDTGTCRIARKDGRITVEIPRDDPQPVRLLPLQQRFAEERKIPYGTALVGLSDDGAPLLIKLPSPNVAHLLIAGTTGSGKSALARTIVTSLALSHRPSQLGFVLIDPKRRAFGPLAGLPHLLRPVLSEPEETDQALGSLVQLMLQRDREQISEPRVVVVIDELADLLMMTDKECQRTLTRLAQRGREAGIHLVACTQKPTSAVVGGLVKANFPVRLVGQVTSPEEAKVATGYAGTGAERLRGPGDFIAVTGGQVLRFQAAYVLARELAEVVEQITRRDQPAGIELPATPQPVADRINGKLAEYVERARSIWPRIRDEGGLVWGGKADIAEVVFGNRSTAGHQGRWVDRVVEALETEAPGTEPRRSGRPSPGRLRVPNAAWIRRKTCLAGPKRRPKTTTTTLKRALLRPCGADEAFEVVVVVIEGLGVHP